MCRESRCTPTFCPNDARGDFDRLATVSRLTGPLIGSLTSRQPLHGRAPSPAALCRPALARGSGK